MGSPNKRPPADDALAHPTEPGAYVGRKPERQAETIPGGIGRDDERIAAHSTQSDADRPADPPSGHRDGPPANDDAVREAGSSA